MGYNIEKIYTKRKLINLLKLSDEFSIYEDTINVIYKDD